MASPKIHHNNRGPGRRERKKQEKLERIKAASRDLFREKGFDRTTMRAIADKADVAMGTLYLYAQDKLELLFLIFSQEIEMLQEQAFRTVDPDKGLLSALSHIFGIYFDYYGKDPRLAQIFHKELLTERGQNQKDVTALTMTFLNRLAGLIQAAQKRGELRPDVSAFSAASNFFCIYYFMIQAWLGGYLGERHEMEKRFQASLKLQIEGLTS